MKTLQWHSNCDELPDGTDGYQLSLVFGHPDNLDETLLSGLEDRFPGSVVVGCTAGNFFHSGQVFERGYSVSCLGWDQGAVHAEPVSLDPAERSSATDIATKLHAHGLPTGAIMFWNGSAEVAESFLHELQEELGPGCPIVGGMAADAQFEFKHMAVFCGSSRVMAVVVGLYGESLSINSSHATGLAWIGRTREITKTDGCAVLEIDGEPAINVLERLGIDMSKEPKSRGLSSLQMVTDTGDPGLVRTPLRIDQQNGSLICGAPVPEGTARLLSFTDPEAILQSATEAVDSAINTTDEGFCLVINCAARYKMLGPLWELELDHVSEALRPEIPSAGFYAYGEIAPISATGRSELHSQTIMAASIHLAR